MSEAVAPKLNEAEVGAATALVALIEEADGAGIAKLTLEMIKETAEWVEQRLPNSEKAGGLVRGWWLNRIRQGWDGEVADEFERRWEDAFAKAQPAETPELEEVKAQPEVELLRFHPSDHALKPEAPPTHDDKNAALKLLAELRETDPLEYVAKKKEWAKRLCTTQEAIDQAVKIERDKQTDDEQSQSTKLVAIGVGDDVELWHTQESECFATVPVASHRENYRIGSTGFEEWLQYEYGRRHQAKTGDKFVPQAPSGGALKDAIRQLNGFAKYRGDLRASPAIRVGGDRDVIWIDLGGRDWRAVRVTCEGWEVVPKAEVGFLRFGSMLSLPEPRRGGNIAQLRGVLNVQPKDFVLVVGWQLQALNPVGAYPVMNVYGDSEAGKSTIGRYTIRTVNPVVEPLRLASRKVEDVLIAARNGWTVGLDNLSWMTAEWSDVLCTISTGIAKGTRAHYTNDEEHFYAVRRPVLFNGIAVNLTERSDLASRTIKLHIPTIEARKSDHWLETEFQRIWPDVFGALLDGLVGGLRDKEKIEVPVPARLMDFEQFAEAGCRAMGFEEWEFVEAYAANRHGSMAASAEASAVGRAVMALMQAKEVKKAGGRWVGKVSALHKKLETWKGHWRDWPIGPTQLSTELSRLRKPLAAVGIRCSTGVDRRSEGGSQQDVVLEWKEGHPGM